MSPKPPLTGLIGFIATLVAIVLLSKIGGSGADLAIMTGLIGVLGMLAPGLVPSRGNEQRPHKLGGDAQPVNVAEVGGEPVKP